MISVVIALGLPGIPLSNPAYAQVSPGTLKEVASGPFRIAVIATPPEPVAGLGPRFTVDVVTAKDGAPVTDADVTIAMTWPSGKDAGAMKLAQNPSNRRLYEGRVTLQDPGEWAWQVSVSNPLGVGLVDGGITVRSRPSSGGLGLIAWPLMLAALGVLLGLAYLNLRPRRTARP